MEELESQIAKIQLGNFKFTGSFVFVMAEKAAGGDAELYIVAELPLLNPAAVESHEKICLAIASTLKRAYRRQGGANDSENAISLINEELAKLASLGQTHWIDKLNCIIGVKEGAYLTIASVGKVAAYLFRGGEFTDISCSPAHSHPMKTFENYTTGKIKINDLLIFSTTQLFNYVAIDRLKDILLAGNFLASTQTIIELLKENGGPEVAFATLLNLQVAVGQTPDEEIDLENYILEQPRSGTRIWEKALNYIKMAFAMDKGGRVPKVALPQVSMAQKIKNFGGGTKNALSKGGRLLAGLGRTVKAGSAGLDLSHFKNFSRQKKFFFISSLVLLVVVVVNIFVTIHVRAVKKDRAKLTAQLTETQALLDNAKSSLLYKDEASAREYLNNALQKLPVQENVTKSGAETYAKLNQEIKDLKLKIDKVSEPAVTNLGNIGQAGSLIKAPNFVATQNNKNILSYNKQGGQLQDGQLQSPETILANIDLGNNQAVIYSGSALFVWDYSTGQVGPGFSQNVVPAEDFGGISYYPTNSRVYLLNKKSGQITNFLVNKTSINRPVVALSDSNLTKAQDFTIDSSIYVLASGNILKYQAGKAASFKATSLLTPLSQEGKIYTHKDFNYIYVLDAANHRVVIFDKQGNLNLILQSPQFTRLKDFQVDEKTKTIYLLNESSLLKVVY